MILLFFGIIFAAFYVSIQSQLLPPPPDQPPRQYPGQNGQAMGQYPPQVCYECIYIQLSSTTSISLDQ